MRKQAEELQEVVQDFRNHDYTCYIMSVNLESLHLEETLDNDADLKGYMYKRKTQKDLDELIPLIRRKMGITDTKSRRCRLTADQMNRLIKSCKDMEYNIQKCSFTNAANCAKITIPITYATMVKKLQKFVDHYKDGKG